MEEVVVNHRKKNLRRRYGMAPEQYDALLLRQEGRCAICGGMPATFHVDHDHATGEVRALLCPECNKGLGHFRDNAALLRSAAEYLEKFR